MGSPGVPSGPSGTGTALACAGVAHLPTFHSTGVLATSAGHTVW